MVGDAAGTLVLDHFQGELRSVKCVPEGDRPTRRVRGDHGVVVDDLVRAAPGDLLSAAVDLEQHAPPAGGQPHADDLGAFDAVSVEVRSDVLLGEAGGDPGRDQLLAVSSGVR